MTSLPPSSHTSSNDETKVRGLRRAALRAPAGLRPRGAAGRAEVRAFGRRAECNAKCICRCEDAFLLLRKCIFCRNFGRVYVSNRGEERSIVAGLPLSCAAAEVSPSAEQSRQPTFPRQGSLECVRTSPFRFDRLISLKISFRTLFSTGTSACLTIHFF